MPNATAIWRPYRIMRCPSVSVPVESKRVSLPGYQWRSARLGLLFSAVLPSERSNSIGKATAAQLFLLACGFFILFLFFATAGYLWRLCCPLGYFFFFCEKKLVWAINHSTDGSHTQFAGGRNSVWSMVMGLRMGIKPGGMGAQIKLALVIGKSYF